MVTPSLRWLMPAALGLGFWAAAAQTPASTARKADPLDAGAIVPAVVYESTFSRHRRSAGDKPIDWREANDTTARIGGWRAYAREAQQPDPAPSAPAAAPARAMPVPSGHGGHKMP